MGRKLETLALFSGLLIGSLGGYYFNDHQNKKEKSTNKSKLTGTLRLKTEEVPYFLVGRINAYDESGNTYEIFYNGIEGTASISESKIIADFKGIDF